MLEMVEALKWPTGVQNTMVVDGWCSSAYFNISSIHNRYYVSLKKGGMSWMLSRSRNSMILLPNFLFNVEQYFVDAKPQI